MFYSVVSKRVICVTEEKDKLLAAVVWQKFFGAEAMGTEFCSGYALMGIKVPRGLFLLLSASD